MDALQLRGLGEGLLELVPQLMALADILPADTLNWKLQLLTEGCLQVRASLPKNRVLLTNHAAAAGHDVA